MLESWSIGPETHHSTTPILHYLGRAVVNMMGLKIMAETLGTAVGKNVDCPPERLVDYSLLREVQKELSIP